MPHYMGALACNLSHFCLTFANILKEERHSWCHKYPIILEEGAFKIHWLYLFYHRKKKQYSIHVLKQFDSIPTPSHDLNHVVCIT